MSDAAKRGYDAARQHHHEAVAACKDTRCIDEESGRWHLIAADFIEIVKLANAIPHGMPNERHLEMAHELHGAYCSLRAALGSDSGLPDVPVYPCRD